MDLWQLKIFTRVVQHKSFSKAGESVFLSQPTVSSHIKDLETHFGCKLIDRLGREVVPTRAGQLLDSYARKLLDTKDEAEAALSDFLGNARGELKVGGSTIPAGYLLPRIIGAFKTDYPDIRLTVMAQDSATILDQVLTGEVEVGIVGTAAKNSRLLQEKIMDDDLRLIVPAAHPWADRQAIHYTALFNNIPFLSRSRGSGTWESVRNSMMAAGARPDRLNIIARLGSTAAVVQGILNHAGVSILSTLAVTHEIAEHRVVAISLEGLTLKRCFFLTTHRKRTLSPLAHRFIDFIRTPGVLQGTSTNP